CSGCGFRQRAPASAASLGSGPLRCLAMPPPHPDLCKDDSAGYGDEILACRAACHYLFASDKHGKTERSEHGNQESEPPRHNPADIHGVIPFTSGSPARCARNRSTRSATASRPSAVNGQRAAAITTNGSAATTSVHAAGSENNCPFSSCR